MDDQVSIRAPNLDSSPIREETKDLSDLMACIEFGIFQESIDEMKTAGIPHYRQHHPFISDSVSLSFRTLFARWKPDEFVVMIEVELGLIEHHGIVPRSLLLTPQHGTKLSRESHPIQLVGM
jgi:hypothetical protein